MDIFWNHTFHIIFMNQSVVPLDFEAYNVLVGWLIDWYPHPTSRDFNFRITSQSYPNQEASVHLWYPLSNQTTTWGSRSKICLNEKVSSLCIFEQAGMEYNCVNKENHFNSNHGHYFLG